MKKKPILYIASVNNKIRKDVRSGFNCPLPVSGTEVTKDELLEEMLSKLSLHDRKRYKEYDWII